MYTKEKEKAKSEQKTNTKQSQRQQKSNTLFKVRLSHCQDQGYVFSFLFFCETDVCQ